MVQVQFSLSWDAHNNNFSYGLSSLQQNGEFVDMTLAADGHHVKVHQLIMALASPYIKELITSAQCSHPVIFLNKISYTTLCALLEYVYTGEVLVAQDGLTALMEAGKELHIKGLDEMKLDKSLEEMATQALLSKTNRDKALSESICTPEQDVASQSKLVQNDTDQTEPVECVPVQSEAVPETTYSRDSQLENEIPNFVITKLPAAKNQQNSKNLGVDSQMSDISHMSNHSLTGDDDSININEKDQIDVITEIISSKPEPDITKIIAPVVQILYTVSCQGSLQMILNRYIYYLRYTWKDGSQRKWQCINYIRNRCPAAVCTKGDVVIERIGAHSHPFHDKQVLKRLKNSSVYTTVIEAEAIGRSQKLQKKKPAKSKEKETEIE